MTKLAMLALFVIFSTLQYRLWVADGGYAEIYRLNVRIADAEARNDQMRSRNMALEAEIADLRSGVAAMEGRARLDLGMVRPDEQFYLISRPD